MAEKPIEEVYELIKNIIPEIKKALPIGEPEEGTQIKLDNGLHIIAASYWRCRSLFESVLLLVEAASSEEACIIGRSLLENSLELYHISKAKEEFRLQYIAYLLRCSNNNTRSLLEIIRKHSPKKQDIIDSKIQKDISSLDDFKKMLNIKNERKVPDITSLVKQYMEEDEVWLKFGHIMTHGTMASQLFRVFINGNKEDLFLKSNGPLVGITALYPSLVAMLYARIAVCGLLGWGDAAPYEGLIDKIRSTPDATMA